MATADEKTRERNPKRERRRLQLIQATIDSIAKHGFAGTTLAHVSAEAGLSGGIVNLHFTNKETLLVETLQFLCDEYQQAWESTLAKAKGTAADKLKALVAVDFKTSVSDRKKLGVWFAFMGEAKTRPTYRQISESQEDKYHETISGIIQELIDEGGYVGLDAEDSADMIMALCDGLWLSLLLSPDQTSRRDAHNSILHLLAMLFPKHFPR